MSNNTPLVSSVSTGDLFCSCYGCITAGEVQEVIDLVKQAFGRLQGDYGFACREAYGNCHRCSAALLSEELLEEPDPKSKGLEGEFAFYTSYDVQYLAVHGELFIAFGFVGTQPNDADPEFSTIIGEMVFAALGDTDLTVQWDFNGSHRIRVKHPKHNGDAFEGWMDHNRNAPPVSAFCIQ